MMPPSLFLSFFEAETTETTESNRNVIYEE
jgi:hypothetical protein